ncbi:MAG: HAMP domain-containing histidine kinase [Candidatus Eisenbacteria bacterium]|jgi:signal transduction histidine kinase|nr:HAMP domain-containing histidine kinase [Candidatus Eisenbacteria bacterium]
MGASLQEVPSTRTADDEQHVSGWTEHRRTVAEILSAITEPETYALSRNLYLIVGLLWGLAVTSAAWLLSSSQQGFGATPRGVWRMLAHRPSSLAMLLVPVAFTVFLGALGYLKHRRDRYIAALLQELGASVQRLATANEELRELDRLKEEFTSNITHELKTPLVTIKGYTELLLGGDLGTLGETQQRSLKVIAKNGARLIELIDQILLFRQQGAVPLPRQLRPFPLRDLLAEVEVNFRPQIEGKHLDFRVDMPTPMITVVADRSRIERVFANLISNAIKFTPDEGSITIRATVPHDGRVGVSVEDNGCGIPKDAQQYIFDRYRQADGSVRRRFGGTGLGLAIVKRILHAHGVDITVESAVGKGSIFRFELPVLKSSRGR